MKTIIKDIKLLIEYKLKINVTKNIYVDVLFSILELIENKEFLNITSEHLLSGNEICLNEFKKYTNRCKEVITRHIEWLVKEGIVWRSKLSYDISTDAEHIKYNTYRYAIHWDLKIDNIDRFIFESVNDIEIDNKIPSDANLLKIFNVLNKLDVNINDAIIELYQSDKSNKRQQSKVLYNIALCIHSIGYGSNVNRVFHTLTKLSSFLHKYLYLDGFKLSEIDAKQSQLTLISNLTRHIDSDFHTIIDNGSFYEFLVDYFKQKLSNDEFSGKSGYLKWYDKESNHMKKCHWSLLDKKVIKPIVCGSLFSGFKNSTPITKFMKSRYSSILKEFHNIIGNVKAATFLQNLEALIWIGACIELIDNGILCLPKHDSLLFNKKDIAIVEYTIDKHMKLNGILKYSLNKEIRENKFRYTPDSLEIHKRYDKIEQKSNIQYKFIKDNFIWCGTKSDFYNEYNLDKDNINKLINGSRKSVSGWKICN